MGITYQTPKEQLLERIKMLYHKTDSGNDDMICRLYITGGNVKLSPGFNATSNEIIAFQPMINPIADYGIQWVSVSPNKFYRLKTLNYAQHLLHLKSIQEWPIYIDKDELVIDSSIFAIGIIEIINLFLLNTTSNCHPYHVKLLWTILKILPSIINH